MDNMLIKVAVAATNANGEPDLFFTQVACSKEQYENGDHYDTAKTAAENAGYEPYLAYDENDPPGSALMELFLWETATTVSILDGKNTFSKELATIILHSADDRMIVINYAEWNGELSGHRSTPQGEPLLHTTRAVFALGSEIMLAVDGDTWRNIDNLEMDTMLVKLMLQGARSEELEAAIEAEILLHF